MESPGTALRRLDMFRCGQDLLGSPGFLNRPAKIYFYPSTPPGKMAHIAAHTHTFLENNILFCHECGTLLPLPGDSDEVTCLRCGFGTPVQGMSLPPRAHRSEFVGVKVTSHSRPFAFQKPKLYVRDDEAGGQTVRLHSSCFPWLIEKDQREMPEMWS